MSDVSETDTHPTKDKSFKEYIKNPFNWIIFFTWALLIVFLFFYLDYCGPFIKLDHNSLIVLTLIVILALSQSFDKFSIFKFFEISRKKEEAEKKAKDLKAENFELKN